MFLSAFETRLLTLWLGCGFLALCCLAVPIKGADVQTNVVAPGPDYGQAVVTRNPIKLNQASSIPRPPSTATPAAQQPILKLTGLAASGTNRSAYFMLEEPGQSPRYFSLADGGKHGGLEVVGIDVAAETVRLCRDGVELTLSLKADGVGSAAQLRLEEKAFVVEHTRAHELHQQRERARIERERALAEAELSAREQASQAALTAHESSVADEVNQQTDSQNKSNGPNP